jgi:cytochrome b subunit of formate dehydrogenase
VQKAGLMVVIAGVLIVSGLIISVLGNQLTLEEIIQENGKVSSTQTVSVSVDFDANITPVGIFAVQVMESKESTTYAKILDPSDIEIMSQKVNEDTIEREFDVVETGTYTLLIQGSSDEEVFVTGAIGPLPDTDKKFIISTISTSVLIIGMSGLVMIGIYLIINRKRSI